MASSRAYRRRSGLGKTANAHNSPTLSVSLVSHTLQHLVKLPRILQMQLRAGIRLPLAPPD